MKALTIWQPWASLLACGGKRFETRSWATSYRGPIAIHAATIKIPQVFKKCFPMSEWTYHPDHDAKKLFLDALAKSFEDYAPHWGHHGVPGGVANRGRHRHRERDRMP